MFFIKSNSIPLNGVADSLQGGRPENQDDCGFQDTPLGFLFIICDGMGGGPGGKTASYIAKCEIAKTLSECSPQMPRDKAFRMAASKAQEVMLKMMNENPALQGMGSTFVATLVNSHSAIVAHAGDSRCYLLRGKRVVYRTTDHSLVAELVKKKALTEEQARTSPQSNVISRGLGNISNHAPEIIELPYKKGDRFVLCTDGAWGAMPHKEFLKRLTANYEKKILLSNLSNEVDRIGNQKGGFHDNHTVGIVEMELDSLLKDKREVWMKYGFLSATVLVVILLVLFSVKACVDDNNFIADDNHSHAVIHDEGANTNPPQDKRNTILSLPCVMLDSLENEILEVSGDSLKKGIEKLGKIDSIRIDSNEARKEPNLQEGGSSLTNRKSSGKIVQEAKELIQETIDSLSVMLQKTYKKQRVAAEGQERIWNDCLRLMEKLVSLKLSEATKQKVKSIIDYAKDEKNSRKAKSYVVVDKNGKQYCSCAPGGRDVINELVKKLKELKEDIE